MANIIRRYIDIGANLTDMMYQGVYNGTRKHEPDLRKVLDRSWNGGLDKIIVTGGSLSDCKAAIELVRTEPKLYTTVGCHPTRCEEFRSNPEAYLAELKQLITDGSEKVVAIGECGLDYDRLKFCSKDVQIKYFEHQLHMSKLFNLPLFLHCRAAAEDFLNILSRRKDDVIGGVVHSFDGTDDTLARILDLGLYVGLNGCSLRTEESLSVAAKIPQDRILVETDCPWCEIKPTHPGYKYVKTKFPTVKKEKHNIDTDNQVKGRNEPVNIVQVLEILAAVRGDNIDELAEAVYNNTNTLFFSKKSTNTCRF